MLAEIINTQNNESMKVKIETLLNRINEKQICVEKPVFCFT